MRRQKEDIVIDKKGLGVAGLILVAALSLSACNTIAGVGEDTESVGEAIEGAAEGAS